MAWLIALVLLVVVGYILDREVYFYEGVRLGPRVQSWLYDRWSKQYDAGKRESQLRDDELLVQPLLEKLQGLPAPLVLDFATGTGRLSLALVRRDEFQGHIIALDISQGMLEQAAEKLTNARGDEADIPPVEWIRHTSMPLPFPDATFDVVCCLEVLELLPDAPAALREMSRLLRPGGILLASRGTEASGRKRRVMGESVMTSVLETSGFENVRITKWWKFFDRVLASKKGTGSPSGVKRLVDVLKCSSCGEIRWQRDINILQCMNCDKTRVVTRQGIVLQ